jgi:hypothetical protein
MYAITGLTTTMAINSPSGSPVHGQKLMLRIKDTGSAQTLNFNAIFRAVGITVPTTTTASKTLYLGFIYNTTDTKWDLIAKTEES